LMGLWYTAGQNRHQQQKNDGNHSYRTICSRFGENVGAPPNPARCHPRRAVSHPRNRAPDIYAIADNRFGYAHMALSSGSEAAVDDHTSHLPSRGSRPAAAGSPAGRASPATAIMNWFQAEACGTIIHRIVRNGSPGIRRAARACVLRG
jgi:hypothetical protein